MTFDKFYESVCKFNNLAGNKNTHEAFKAQMKCLKEEVQETEDALLRNDPVKILDGAVDTIYVAMGMLQKLQELGVDVNGALRQVAEDNLTKFPSNMLDAVKTVEFYASQGINTGIESVLEYSRYVIKDENRKVRKPFNFKATELSEYVPRNLREEGIKV
jgi:hypothetical protein